MFLHDTIATTMSLLVTFFAYVKHNRTLNCRKLIDIVQKDNYNLFISILLVFGFTFPTNGTKTNYNTLTLILNDSKANHNRPHKIRYLGSILSNLDKIINSNMYTTLTTVDKDKDENPNTSILSQYKFQLLTSMDLIQLIPHCLFGEIAIIVNECKKQNDFTVIAQLLSVINLKLLADIKKSHTPLISNHCNYDYTCPTSSFDQCIDNERSLMSPVLLSVINAYNKAFGKATHQWIHVLKYFALAPQINAQIKTVQTTARTSSRDHDRSTFTRLATADKISTIIDKTAEWMVQKMFSNQVFENEFDKHNLKLDKHIMIKMKNDYKYQYFMPLLKASDCVVSSSNNINRDHGNNNNNNLKRLSVNSKLYHNIIENASQLREKRAYLKFSNLHTILWNIKDDHENESLKFNNSQFKLKKFIPIGQCAGDGSDLLQTRIVQQWKMQIVRTRAMQRQFKIDQLCRISNCNARFVKENFALWMVNKHFGKAIDRLKSDENDNCNNYDLRIRKILLENITKDATELFHNAYDNCVEQYVNLYKTKLNNLESIKTRSELMSQFLDIANGKAGVEIVAFYNTYPCCLHGPSWTFGEILRQFPDSAHNVVTSILFGANKLDDCLFDEFNLTKYDCNQLKQIQNDCEKEYWQKFAQDTQTFRSIIKNQKYWQCFVCGKNNKSAIDVSKEKMGCTQESMSCNNDNCAKKGQSLNPLYFALKNKCEQFTVKKQHGLAFVNIFLKVEFGLFFCFVYNVTILILCNINYIFANFVLTETSR